MKLVQIVLINLATVAVALVVYDQLQSDASGPSARRLQQSRVNDTADLEQRLQALEAEFRRVPRAEGTDARVMPDEAAREHAAPGALPKPEQTQDEARPIERESPLASREEPSAKEVRKFRQLREAVRREDRVKKNKARVDGALKKLAINLTQSQRARIHTAFAAFEPRVGEIWTEVKTQAQQTIAAGGDVDRGEIVTSTTAIIQQEFAATLTGIVNHQADAEAIATALMPGGK